MNAYSDFDIKSDYFGYDNNGQLCVKNGKNLELLTPLSMCCEHLHHQSVQMPVVLHFQHILEHRLNVLYSNFDNEIALNNYIAEYHFAYPIKVNPKAHILKSLQENCQKMGKTIHFEVGTKTELLAVLGIAKNDSMIICNGFKDKDYYEIANSAALLGFNVILVIEHFQELNLIQNYFKNSTELHVKFGLRVKPFKDNLHALKFGMSLYEITQTIELFKQYDKTNLITLIHGHIGSQLTDEAGLQAHIKFMLKLYADLSKNNVPINYIDFGGGLGVDYTFSGDSSFCLTSYAKIIISYCKFFADELGVKHPNIITESGRAITAPAEILLVQPHYEVKQNKILTEQQAQIDAKWLDNEIDLFTYKQEIDLSPIQLSSQKHLWLNFSIFQSVPDQWGINQTFPLLPLQTVFSSTQDDVLIFDISCDADGVFKDKQRNHLHRMQISENTPLAVLYVGAYQSMLSSKHNLIGESNFVFVDFKQNGKFSIHTEKLGFHSTLLTDYGHNPLNISTRLRRRLNNLSHVELTISQRAQLHKLIDEMIHISPYLTSNNHLGNKESYNEMAS
jgi:arginine decarboxylase